MQSLNNEQIFHVEGVAVINFHLSDNLKKEYNIISHICKRNLKIIEKNMIEDKNDTDQKVQNKNQGFQMKELIPNKIFKSSPNFLSVSGIFASHTALNGENKSSFCGQSIKQKSSVQGQIQANGGDNGSGYDLKYEEEEEQQEQGQLVNSNHEIKVETYSVSKPFSSKKNYLSKCLQLLQNFLTNKYQRFKNFESECEYIRMQLGSSFQNFMCVQRCLTFIFLIIWAMNISQLILHAQSDSVAATSIAESLVSLVVFLLDLGLLLISRNCRESRNGLIVRTCAVSFQLAQTVYLWTNVVRDFNMDFVDVGNNEEVNNLIASKRELLFGTAAMFNSFWIINGASLWCCKLIVCISLLIAYIILFYEQSLFWLFAITIICLTLFYVHSCFADETKTRNIFSNSYLTSPPIAQDMNSPSLYNMIHDQISSGLIVVQLNESSLKLKFANKISFSQLKCHTEDELLAKFKEISVPKFQEQQQQVLVDMNQESLSQLPQSFSSTSSLYQMLWSYLDDIHKQTRLVQRQSPTELHQNRGLNSFIHQEKKDNLTSRPPQTKKAGSLVCNIQKPQIQRRNSTSPQRQKARGQGTPFFNSNSELDAQNNTKNEFGESQFMYESSSKLKRKAKNSYKESIQIIIDPSSKRTITNTTKNEQATLLPQDNKFKQSKKRCKTSFVGGQLICGVLNQFKNSQEKLGNRQGNVKIMESAKLLKENRDRDLVQKDQEVVGANERVGMASKKQLAPDKDTYNQYNMIQVQFPTSEKQFLQFDFKINQIEWDNAPALIILVTDSTEKMINEKLKELEIQKEELLYTMQHISRTPLNSIINISEILLNEYYKQYKITSSCKHLQQHAPSFSYNNIIPQKQSPTTTPIIGQRISQSEPNTNPIIIGNSSLVSKTNTEKHILTNSIKQTEQQTQHIDPKSQYFLANAADSPINGKEGAVESQIMHQKKKMDRIDKMETKERTLKNQTSSEKKIGELEDIVQNLLIIKNNGYILLHTINTVTDLSVFQTNQGKLKIEADNFSIRSVLDDIYNLYLHQIKEKNLEFSVFLPPQLDKMRSDKKRIVQVLFEIIGNAIKYTQDGFIHVKIKEQEKGLLWVKVQDSGVGMSESHKKNLFRNRLIQYYSRERDFSKKTTAGLGLDFSRKIVGIIGPFYQIFIKSAEGEGSSFKFLLYSNYDEREQIDIPALRTRIMMLQNDQSEVDGEIFTPDIVTGKNINRCITNKSLSSRTLFRLKKAMTSVINISPQNLSVNNQEKSLQQAAGASMFAQNPFGSFAADGINPEEVVKTKELSATQNNKRNIELNVLEKSFRPMENKEKTVNLPQAKQYNPFQMSKYLSLDYCGNQRYNFPQSANNLTLSTGSKNKFLQLNECQDKISQTNSPWNEIKVPCIGLTEEVYQRYLNETQKLSSDQDIHENDQHLPLDISESKNFYAQQLPLTFDFGKRIDRVMNKDLNTQVHDTSTTLKRMNQQGGKSFTHKNQSFVQLPKLETDQNLKNASVASLSPHQKYDYQNPKLSHQQLSLLKSLTRSYSLRKNSSRINDEEDSNNGIGERRFSQQSQTYIGDSIILPKCPQESTMINSNNLRSHGLTNVFRSKLQMEPPKRLDPGLQTRADIAQVIGRANFIDDGIYEEDLKDIPFISSHETIQKADDSLSIQKSKQYHITHLGSTPHSTQLTNSPIRRVEQERKKTKTSSQICQSLKIDDYESKLYRIFPEKSYILGIDDNIFNLSILEMIFKQCTNVIFHKASNGQICIEKALQLQSEQNTSYKLFLMDIQMPIMDGYKAHSKLKKLMKRNQIQQAPVFAVTAFTNEKQICLEQGMEGFVEKPINMKILISLLFDYFTKPQVV